MRRELVWPEARIVDAVREIELSGVSLDDVTDRATVDAFLGPTDPEEIATLPALDAAQDAAVGSGRYGDAWRLPLGHEARASVGVRLALLGDRRKGGLGADGLPDIDWVAIDGGEVTIEIRANPDDPNSKVVRCLTREVASFSMARSAQGQTPAEAGPASGAYGHILAAGDCAGLVWRRRAPGRDYVRNRGVVPCRPAGGRDPLGSGARSRREVRSPGVPVHRS
jgi:hypothetical protein